MAQPINPTTWKPKSKGMVKIMPAGLLSVLVLLVSLLFVGCQSSNAMRQGTMNGGVTSERLTYRQYPVPQHNPVYQSPRNPRLTDFLNPLKLRVNRIHSLHSSGTSPQNFQLPAQNPSMPQLPAGLPGNTPSQTPLLRDDDPQEIIEFAALLNGTGQFSTEQKAEIVELLRRESPAIRSSLMANYLVAIRHSGTEGNLRLANSAFNPIGQVSHVSSIRERDLSESPIRLANNNIENELRSLESQALGHALYTTDNTQGMIRQVADESMRNTSMFRISRPRGEPSTIPEIDTNPTLPTVATPADYATLRLMESSNPAANINTSDPIRDDREILRFSQPRSPEEPDWKSRIITPDQQAGTRQGNRNTSPNGTRIAIVDSNTRIPPIIPSLSDMEEDRYGITNVSQKPDDTVNTEYADAHSPKLATQTYTGGVDTMASLDLQAAPQVRNVIPPFQLERWDETARLALNLLNAQIADSDTLEHKEQLHDEIHQRLICLTLGNQRDAIKPINGMSLELQEFWHNTMLGLSTMLDVVSFPESSYRFDAAHRHLQTANLFLQNLCPVRIRKVSFVNQCDGFGVYEMASNEFHRGEPIFIYAEIDNLTCRENSTGYLTQVNSSYEIFDVFGNKVANGEFSKTGKHTRSRIRDIFLLWRVDLPENIMPGKYFINLSVIDTNHQDYPIDQQRLELNVLPPLNNR